jgi:hypothetical protein
MKTINLLVLLTFYNFIVPFAQDRQLNPTRRLSTFTAIYECTVKGENSNLSDPMIAQAGALFDSIGVKEIGSTKYFIIKFLVYTGNPKLQSTYNLKIAVDSLSKYNGADLWNQTELHKFFLISESDFLGKSISFIKESTVSMTYGALTIPIKLRFESGKIYDSSKDLTLGSVAGIRFKPQCMKGNSLVGYFGLGITSVSLDSSNTFGEITGVSDRSAITLTSGIMFESRKGIQVGITAGWDYIGRKEQIDWVNNGNLWLGFGVGFSLFSESKPVPAGEQSNKPSESADPKKEKK